MRRKAIPTVGILLMAATVLTACTGGVDGGEGTTTTSPPNTTTSPETPPAIEDGEWFAFVEVGTDESDQITLGIDLAEMLTGEEARQAAIDAGVIGEDEDLPNDFFIVNEDEIFELLHVADGAQFALISGNDTSHQVVVNADVFADIYNGGDAGEPIYGIPGGAPIAMNVTIADGMVTGAEAVYLP